MRSRWLNPPEWTKTEVLEFPGSVDGPWARYIDPATVRPIGPHPNPLPKGEGTSGARPLRKGEGTSASQTPRSSLIPHPSSLSPAAGCPHPGPLPKGEGTCIGTVRWPRIVPKDPDCAESLKRRTLTNLYNERPAWLDLAHRRLDEAVFAAYGWDPGLSDEALLERLLELNLERARTAV